MIIKKKLLIILGIAGIALFSIIIFSALNFTEGFPSGFYTKPTSSVRLAHLDSASLAEAPAERVGNEAEQNLVEGSSWAVSGLSASSTGKPIRLKIPKINVDAAIEQVGIAPDRTMDVPKGPANAGWFNLGPRPGEKGSSVISGHYGWKNNIPAAFDNLHKLQKGDKIYVEDERGVVIVFVVRGSRSYDPKADASDVFGSSDGKAHLNLVTCEGIWDKAEKSYSKRLVVFTDREEK